MNIKKTTNLLIIFATKRLAEILGITVFILGLLLFISLSSYSPDDPNFIFPDNKEIKNILGFQGSFVSDLFFQSIGLVSYLFSITLIITGINIFKSKSPPVLYGGSVDGNSVKLFKKIREIDGFLVGGASKSSKKFIDIIRNYYR